jgi:cytoskeletal protein CcmA (bactofilin family)
MQPGQSKDGQTPSPEALKSGDVPAQTAPKDALGKTNDELAQDLVDATSPEDKKAADAAAKAVKKPNPIKRIFHKVDVYLLGFILVMVLAGAFAMINYLNSKKVPKTPTISSQPLTASALKALASSGTSIGNSAQTLTLQGNVIFSGQVLMRSDLDVAGDEQIGGKLLVPSLTVSGTSNLATTQINTLQVAKDVTIQGNTTLASLTVSGASTFNGPVTAGAVTVTSLTIGGTGVLDVPNHIAFTGPSPGRSSINTNVLGAGGTASVNGSDNAGSININSGNDPTAGCYLLINFAKAYTTMPHVILSPIDAAAGATEYYAIKTTTGFSVCTDNAPAANQAFSYDYWVTGE